MAPIRAFFRFCGRNRQGARALRRPRIGVLGLISLLAACAGGVPAAQAPCDVPASSEVAVPPSTTTDGSLPRYVTVRLQNDQVWVADQAVVDEQLSQVLSQAAADERNQGAALVAAPGVDRAAVEELFARLLGAGFGHVVVSGVTPTRAMRARNVAQTKDAVSDSNRAPDDEAATVVANEAEKRSEKAAEPSASKPEPTPQTDLPEVEVPTDVLVKRMGVHLGGGPNDEETHQRFARPIEKQFNEFLKCHWLADKRAVNASFGVDLLISTRGGRAKIQDYRTALKGKEFHLCMLGVFGAVRFPAPEQPTVLSYSLLFKPKSP